MHSCRLDHGKYWRNYKISQKKHHRPHFERLAPITLLDDAQSCSIVDTMWHLLCSPLVLKWLMRFNNNISHSFHWHLGNRVVVSRVIGVTLKNSRMMIVWTHQWISSTYLHVIWGSFYHTGIRFNGTSFGYWVPNWILSFCTVLLEVNQ